MKFTPLAALCIFAASSASALEGQILDREGNAIEGALIEVVGERLFTQTDNDGQFDLPVKSENEIHVSAPGFSHQTIHLDADKLDENLVITLSKSVIEQVDVIGIPLHTSNIESAMPVHVLSGDDLISKQAATLGDALAGEVGVHSNFHGNVASTPIIRGLSGPRVLVTQNNLDVSDASRVGPDHAVATETSTAERIEVLKGPATLFFGSGAIGGVVNVVDNRVPTETKTEGSWLLSHDSVNNQALASVNINTGLDQFAFHFDGFLRDSDDYKVPHDSQNEGAHHESDTIENTAENSHGFTFGSSYILDNGYLGFSYGKLDRDYGVPGHNHGEEEREDIEHQSEHEDSDHQEEQVTLGLKQDRLHIISELTLDHAFINSINTRIGYTDYTHKEFENGEASTVFSNETGEVRLDLLHQPLSDWNGGIVFNYKTTRFKAEGEEAFAPASKTNTLAIALLEEKHFGNILVQMGARAEHVEITSDDISLEEIEFHQHNEHQEHTEGDEHNETQEHTPFSYRESYIPFSLSAGAVWEFTPGYNLGFAISHAERAPSASEILSYGPHIATGTFDIGAYFEPHEESGEIHFDTVENALGMERSNNIDITFRKFEGDAGLILNIFYNQIDNYYSQFDTELLAESGHAHEQASETEEDIHAEELPVFAFRRSDATLYGFETQGIWQMTPSIKGTLFADYVRSTLRDGANLARTPPLRFGANIDYTYKRFSVDLSATHYYDQNKVAELETPTEGYDWVNASVNYHIPYNAMTFTFFVKAENILDTEARVHSSFIKDLAPRPARNLRIGVRGSF